MCIEIQSSLKFTTIMTSKKVQNIFTSFKPLYIYLKIFGLLLYTYNGNISDGYFEIKLKDKIWSLFSIFMIIGAGILFLNFETTFWSYSLILMNAYKLCAVFGFLVAIIAVFYQWKYSNKILKILLMIHEFDEKVKK